MNEVPPNRREVSGLSSIFRLGVIFCSVAKVALENDEQLSLALYPFKVNTCASAKNPGKTIICAHLDNGRS